MDNHRTQSRLHRPDGGPVRVLVVDDEPDLTEVLAGALSGEGWQVRTAADGASALATAREFRPDAVVLDWMLPDLDGLRVLRELRREAREVCVLFLTARDAVEDRIAGITAGGDDYVTKPFSLEEVLARLRGLLRRAGMAGAPGLQLLTVGEPHHGRGGQGGPTWRRRHRAVPHRVRAAAVPDAQSAPRAVQGTDTRPGLGV